MRKRRRHFLAPVWSAALLLSATAVSAQAAELPPCDVYDPAADVLNPDGNPDLRRQALERLVARSQEDGNSYGRYVLGNLYRLGREHPAGLVDRDLAKARPLLSNAALDGHMMAMAGMAEIELARGEPMGAMVWAQAYNHYSARHASFKHGNKAYLADLLDRIYERLGRSREVDEEIREYLASFILNHGPRLEAAFEARRNGKRPAACRTPDDGLPVARLSEDRPKMRQTRSAKEMHSPGLALFRLRINPAGEVVQVVVVDSLPDRTAAEGLRDTAQRMRFNAVDSAAPERSVQVPLSYDDLSVRLRD